MENVFGRITGNMRDPRMRANVAALIGGKVIGLGIVLFVMHSLATSVAHAQDASTPDPVASINAINTAWVLIAAFLVFGM